MPLAINDEFSSIPNKHARQYFRWKRDGLCIRCGKERDDEYLTCISCRADKAARQKAAWDKRHPKPTAHTSLSHQRPSKYQSFIQP